MTAVTVRDAQPAIVPRLISLAESERATGLSKIGFREIVLPHVRTLKAGGRRLVYLQDLLQWIEANTTGPEVQHTESEVEPRLRRTSQAKGGTR